MILDTVKAKLAAYAFPIIGTLVVIIGIAFWWLLNERDDLLAANASLTQALSNAAHANRENLDTIKSQAKEIQWRSQKAIERQNRVAALRIELAGVHSELKGAMRDAPECVDQPWPDAVLNIMRRNTVSDPNRVREGAGTD